MQHVGAAGHSITLELTNVSCYNFCDGKAKPVVTGGTGPFVVHWLGNGLAPNTTADSLVTLCPGSYSVEVIDKSDNSSSGVLNFQILNAPPFFWSVSETPISCFGEDDGAITINVSGAKPPYSYSWSTGPKDTSNTIDTLTAGIYFVQVTDSNGCTFHDTFDLAQPDTISPNITISDVTCKDLCTGTAISLTAGGTAPYQFLWSNADTTAKAKGLCDGTYTVLITDANGCLGEDTITVNEPDSLLVNFSVDSTTCADSCNGKIIPVVTGGVTPYQFHWAPGSSSDSIYSGLCTGQYVSTITDSNGCFVATNLEVKGPTKISITDSIGLASCGLCDGAIKVFPSGGSGTYKYLWNTGNPNDTFDLITGLCAGTYEVQIMDSLACSKTFTIVLNDSSSLVGAALQISPPTCNDAINGSATVIPIGGIKPFTYLWSPGGATDSTAFNLGVGKYFVTITDSAGCKYIEEVNIPSKPEFKFNALINNTRCNTSCDGDIVVNPVGGTPPYNYVWTETSANAAGISGLCSGMYHLTIIDKNGCSYIDSFFVDTATSLQVNINVVDASCSNSCNGYAFADITGGTPPYSYSWSNGSINDTVMNLCSGNYSLLITDKNNCTASANFNVNSPSEIVANATTTNADCNFNDGKILLNPSGGTGPYSYYWTNGTKHDSLTGLSAGIYTVLITDFTGCFKSFKIPVSNLNGPQINVVKQNSNCYGKCTGTAVASAVNSQGPYTYNWSTGDTTSTVSGLCAGNYFIQITTGNGCSSFQQVTISEPPAIDFSFQISEETCEGACDGEAIATVTGGIPPYNFNWSSGGNLNAINNLCSGKHSLIVNDAVNCAVTKQYEIKSYGTISINFDRKNVNCANSCEGSLKAIITGGKPPYQYSWSNGTTTPFNPGLCIGTYTLDVTDANGCVQSASIQIGSKSTPILANIVTANASCGMCDGTATISASGGNGSPYTYTWSSSIYSGNNVTNLCAGIYNVTISDNLGCSKNFTVNINNTGGPSLVDSIVNVSCFGDCNGKAFINATNNGPFNYFWSDSSHQTTDSAINLCVGNYSVIVTDTNGCLSTRNISITEPTAIQSTYSITAIACIGDSGAIQANISGGTPPYKFLWSTAAIDTLSAIDSLPAGTYSLIVTDTTNCTFNDTIELADPPSMSISFTNTNVLCFSACNATATANVTGGQGPYTITWNDPLNQIGKRAIGLCSGTYTATVMDINGCSAIDSITIIEPPSISLNFIPKNPDCVPGKNGEITINPSGGSGVFTYIWGDGQRTNPAVGLNSGEHTVIVIDGNGCTAYDTITLNKATPLTATFNKTAAQCDSANGSIQVTPAGGSGNYSYVWSTIPTKTSQVVNDLNAGIYKVTITDNISGCSVEYSVILNNIGGPAIALTGIDETCFGACNGSAMVTTTASISDYTWNDPMKQKLATATNLCAGTYAVTVRDTGGCKTSDTITINTTRIITIADNIVNTSCFNTCDGEATVSSTGGKTPYNYSWNTSPVQTGNTAMGLCGGSYVVTTTDSNNCIGFSTVNIAFKTKLRLNINVLTASICNGVCEGKAEAYVFGGTPPYTYIWSNGSTNSFSKGLCSGGHAVVVTDANGCTVTDSFNIISNSPINANPVTTRPLCGEYDGSISISPSGGTGPYFYSWSSGQSTPIITGLFAGIYNLTITDSKGCSRTFTYFLNNPNAPSLNFAENTVKCQGDCNGIAFVAPVGGVSPYKFAWDYVPPSFIDSLKDLCSGVYSVKVTDNVGCIAFGNDTIREPEALELSPTVDNTGCGGACDGEASANGIGGTPPYRYSWNSTPVQTTNTATGLCAGIYQITITDTNDCVTNDNISITPPPTLVVDSITSMPASCNENADGQAAVYVSGGTTPYTYFWNDGNITQIIPNTRGALRIVEVTDANGCKIRDTVLVGVEDTVLVNAIDDFSACFDQEIELSATGNGVISYQWFEVTPSAINQVGNDSIITVILGDTTMYVIRGSNNSSPACVDRDTVFVYGIPAPIVNAGPDETIIRGESTILDNVTPFIPFGFQKWVPGTGLDDSTIIRPRASPSETTTYVITISDENGCFSSDTITVFVTDKEIIYNGISPNGDGINDFWTIELIEDYPNAIVEIYNRWGQQIFRSVGYKEKWDGTYQGNPLPDGTYYYVIDLQVEGKELLSGTITILR